jgi:hypothetical protein
MSQADPISLIHKRAGKWWKDGRQEWCAYCGVKLTAKQNDLSHRTQDHVLPKVHRAAGSRDVTIPACRQCNQAKAQKTIPEFLLSRHFKKVRRSPKPNQWPLQDLWLIMALASTEQARSLSRDWPADKSKPHP